MTVNQFRSKLAAVNVGEVSFESVNETRETIAEIQKGQMYKGLNGEGKKIGRYRSNKYARAKSSMNPLPGLGIPDLKLTGAFYAGMITKVDPETFVTTSTDSKNEALTQKYDPFGLDAQSKIEYAEKLRPVLVKNAKLKLQL